MVRAALNAVARSLREEGGDDFEMDFSTALLYAGQFTLLLRQRGALPSMDWWLIEVCTVITTGR